MLKSLNFWFKSSDCMSQVSTVLLFSFSDIVFIKFKSKLFLLLVSRYLFFALGMSPVSRLVLDLWLNSFEANEEIGSGSTSPLSKWLYALEVLAPESGIILNWFWTVGKSVFGLEGLRCSIMFVHISSICNFLTLAKLMTSSAISGN